MSAENLLIMCGNQLRHKYFAIRLLKDIQNSNVLIEKSRPLTITSKIMEIHFDEFKKEEKKYFEKYVDENREFLKARTVKEIESGTINEQVDFIKNINPKVIAIHSTSLIKEELINAFPKRLINLHAGLSPYYRGAGTNVFPFYDRQLEFIGMTVHYIDIGIDSGDIILQGKPIMEEDDNTHTIGCKNVILGTNLMIRVINRYLEKGILKAVKQDKSKGKLYQIKDFTDEVILSIKEDIDNDLVRNFVSLNMDTSSWCKIVEEL